MSAHFITARMRMRRGKRKMESRTIRPASPASKGLNPTPSTRDVRPSLVRGCRATSVGKETPPVVMTRGSRPPPPRRPYSQRKEPKWSIGNDSTAATCSLCPKRRRPSISIHHPSTATTSRGHREKIGRTAHYGTKPGHFETLKIHFPTSKGVSEVSERASE